MRLFAALASIALTIGCATAMAQPLSFSALEGQWRGQGTFRGAPSEVTATFAPMFEGAAYTLDIDVRFTPANGQPTRFQGKGGYALRNGAPVGGSWIDNFGNGYAISPRFEDNALIVDWGTATFHGRSEYRLEADGDLRVEDFVQGQGGQWQSFALAELRRAH
ncbi:hypothetical protein U91I_03355 [alpha proteobacterium U9-1i]|nr:hypothetical protein U91I_03355 [alpha proteobacterium U9-1i]